MSGLCLPVHIWFYLWQTANTTKQKNAHYLSSDKTRKQENSWYLTSTACRRFIMLYTRGGATNSYFYCFTCLLLSQLINLSRNHLKTGKMPILISHSPSWHIKSSLFYRINGPKTKHIQIIIPQRKSLNCSHSRNGNQRIFGIFQLKLTVNLTNA